jgi:hypothetical protein
MIGPASAVPLEEISALRAGVAAGVARVVVVAMVAVAALPQQASSHCSSTQTRRHPCWREPFRPRARLFLTLQAFPAVPWAKKELVEGRSPPSTVSVRRTS